MFIRGSLEVTDMGRKLREKESEWKKGRIVRDGLDTSREEIAMRLSKL